MVYVLLSFLTGMIISIAVENIEKIMFSAAMFFIFVVLSFVLLIIFNEEKKYNKSKIS